MASGRRVAGAIKFLANAKDLQLEFATVLHETLLAPALMYGVTGMRQSYGKRKRDLDLGCGDGQSQRIAGY